jgi:hypothetical protein
MPCSASSSHRIHLNAGFLVHLRSIKPRSWHPRHTSPGASNRSTPPARSILLCKIIRSRAQLADKSSAFRATNCRLEQKRRNPQTSQNRRLRLHLRQFSYFSFARVTSLRSCTSGNHPLLCRVIYLDPAARVADNN